jgi:hypothetical protein
MWESGLEYKTYIDSIGSRLLDQCELKNAEENALIGELPCFEAQLGPLVGIPRTPYPRFPKRMKNAADVTVQLSNGYPMLGINMTTFSHTTFNLGCSWVTYICANGNLDSGSDMSHRCQNRWCINPEHLAPESHPKNEDRKFCKRGSHFIHPSFGIYRNCPCDPPCIRPVMLKESMRMTAGELVVELVVSWWCVFKDCFSNHFRFA